jgi:uncharacterized protein YxjI
MRLAFLTLALVTLATPAFALDGVNIATGDTVTVADGTTFTEGDTLPVFDADGNQTDYIVQAVKDVDQAIDVDLADVDSGDVTTFEFAKP